MPQKIKIIFLGIVFLSLPVFVSAVSLGQKADFFVDPTYDLTQREEISATLQRIGSNLYFYIDDDWFKTLNEQQRQEVEMSLQNLDSEFYYKIYPALTSTFGYEWKPGIDNDSYVTILIHPIIEKAGGYFNNGDEYSRLQNPRSNEREMVYLNADYINSSLVKGFLAHEFLHLITFNQKDLVRDVSEEIWLNEARSEYVPTLLGYDDVYEESNLQWRIRSFINNPSDSLTEWQNRPADYGVTNLFIQYLVDHYGIEVLSDSLHSSKIGIPSLNEALKKNGFEENFSQIFTDWTIAILVNDCSLGERYCYLNKNLKNFQVNPLANFLPLTGESTLSVTRTTKNWTGNWFKFIGGQGDLKIEFIGDPETVFRIPYVTQSLSGSYSVDFFELDKNQKGEISIPDFRTKTVSVTIIPSTQSKISNFSDNEPAFTFFWSASTTAEEVNPTPEKPISEMTREEILAKIAEIKENLTQLQAQLKELLATQISCQTLEEDLFYGLRNDERVRCLQEFLKSQEAEIYPEGLITGNYLSLTQQAMIRFQEKYASEILAPLGLTQGTGYVGQMTRTKINQLLGK